VPLTRAPHETNPAESLAGRLCCCAGPVFFLQKHFDSSSVCTQIVTTNITATMALRQMISKVLLPNFERDLSRACTSELDSVHHMVDNLLAPQVFAYTPASTSQGGIRATALRSAPVSQKQVLAKVHFPVAQEGLFGDKQESFHSRK